MRWNILKTRETVLEALVFAILLAAMIVGTTLANPLSPPLIVIYSPQNNQIYTTNTIQLNFSVLPASWFNFSSFTYVLDNQPPLATNGTTILTDLSAGSHTLTIYGRGTESGGSTYYEHQDMLVAIVYFSSQYSTTWITFTIIALATGTIIPLMLFSKRRQIIARLRGKKNGVFWLGTALLVFATIIFVPSAWQMATNYLFPNWPEGISIFPPYGLMVIGGLILMGIGFCMMSLGSQKSKT